MKEEKSDFDLAVDMLMEDVKSIKGYVRDSLRTKKPFRKEKVDDSESLAKYLSTDPRVIQEWRTINPEGVARLEQKMSKLMEGMKNG